MDLITLMTFLSLSTVVVALTTIGPNVSTSCNSLMAYISVMSVTVDINTNMTIMAVMAIISVMHEMVILGLMATMAVIPPSNLLQRASGRMLKRVKFLQDPFIIYRQRENRGLIENEKQDP